MHAFKKHFEFLGKRTHNQRIERLWRDVFAGCLSLFYNLFYHFEDSGVLDPDDNDNIWCQLHIFLPIINRHLSQWKNAWLHRLMSYEKNKSPIQLWIHGLQTVVWGSNSAEDDVFQVNLNIIIFVKPWVTYNFI